MSIRRVLAAIIFTGTFAALHAQIPIVWTNPINVGVNSDNSLTKSGGAVAWDATIVSQNILRSGQDGSIEFVYQPGTSQYMVSLSKLNNNADYAASDYSAYVNGTTFRTYNRTTGSGPFAVTSGDVIKVSREGPAINIYVGTAIVKTYTLTNNLDNLRVDVSVAKGSVPIVTASFAPALMVRPTFQYPFPADDNGTITLHTEGQVEPVTYTWSTGENTSTITGKSRGTYTVTATDAASRTVTATYGLGHPVQWTKQTEIVINPDNTITKVGASEWGVSGAYSANVLEPNADGWIEFVLTEPTSDFGIGLSVEDANRHVNSIDYAWRITGTGQALIYENGTSRITAVSTMKGDVFRISRAAGVFKYYINGVLKRSVSGNGTLPFSIDLSVANNMGPIPTVTASFPAPMMLNPAFQFPDISDTNGGISLHPDGHIGPVTYSWSSPETTSSINNKGRGSYTITATDARSLPVTRTYYLGYPVAWTKVIGATVNGNNTLTKAGPIAWGNSGGSSLNRLAPSTDGWVEFVVDDLTSKYMIGLSRVDRNAHYSTMHFAFYVRNNIGRVYQDGTEITSMGIMKGDVIRVVKQGAQIKYYINGILKRTSATTATFTYVVDVAIAEGSIPVVTTSFDVPVEAIASITPPDKHVDNGRIALQVSGAIMPYSILWSSGETTTSITGKARGTYTATVTDAASRSVSMSYRLGYPIQWTDLKKASVTSENTVVKSVDVDNNLWDAAAISTNELAPSTDGWIEYVVPVTPHLWMIGLTRMNSEAAHASINYAFYVNNGVVRIYESGVDRGIFGNQTEGIVLSIAREGATIKYYINGVVVRTVATNTSYQLYVDCAIHSGGIPVVTSSFTRNAQTFYSISDGNWTTPSVWSLTENGPPATAYPGSSDLVVVKGYRVIVDSDVQAAEIEVIANNQNTGLTINGADASLTVNGGTISIQRDNYGGTIDAMVVENDGKVIINP